MTPAEHAAGLGEAYTFTALAMPSRFVAAWHVGKRDQGSANAFIVDLRARLTRMPAIVSDGFAAYVSAIGASFGACDYAQCQKRYTKSGRKDDDHRYEPPRDPFVVKRVVFGTPNLDASNTTHVERNNGTVRHHVGRMRRLCLAFSKNPAHHAAAVALCYVHYNLCWIPRTMRITPAMAAGVTGHVWELPELLDALLSAPEAEKPVAVPLAHRTPATTHRALPGGRGFLRVVPTGSAPAAPPPPPATPPAPPAAPAVAPVQPPPQPPRGQLDLLSWRRPMVQMSLFGDPDMSPREPT